MTTDSTMSWARFFVYYIISAVIIWLSFDYQIGTPREMGPGFFPAMIGFGMTLVTTVQLIQYISHGRRQYKLESVDHEVTVRDYKKLRAPLLIITSILAFIFLYEYIGFVPATFIATYISALAHPKNSHLSAFLISLFTVVMTYIVFIYFLAMHLKSFMF